MFWPGWDVTVPHRKAPVSDNNLAGMANAPKSLGKLRRGWLDRLRAAAIETPELDVTILIEKGAGLDRTGQILAAETPLSEPHRQAVEALIMRRLHGEPLDHIIGQRAFYGRNFTINRFVLSPRPETEGLVDTALEVIQNIKTPHLLDLGTGSGAIIISCLAERLDARGVAVDISENALKLARHNAAQHGVKPRLTVLRSDWFDAVEGSFDIIMSNPPYITDQAMKALMPEVRDYDPHIALRGGEDGLMAYRLILSQVWQYLKPGGWIVLEIGYDQGLSVQALCRNVGLSDICVLKDLSGHDRIIRARRSYETKS